LEISTTPQTLCLHYAHSLFVHEDEHLRTIRRESDRHGLPPVHIQPEEGLLLHFLLRSIGAKTVVEIGTLAGYSATWIARALPEDGKLITLERRIEHAQLARELLAQGGLEDRVEVLTGSALQNLRKLSANGPFDAVFIDADKPHLLEYLDWAVQHVHIGGMVLAHNAFLRGRIDDPALHEDPVVASMRAFHRTLARDPRLLAMILPVGDGLSAALRVA